MDLARFLRTLLGTMLLVLIVAASRPAVAQRDAAADYPDKIIRIVVDVMAGGGLSEFDLQL